MRFDSKCDFAPPTILLGLLLCPLDAGYLFRVGSNILQSMVVQQLIVIFPAQPGIKIAHDTTLMAESEEELRN